MAVDHDGNRIAVKRVRAARISLDGWGDLIGESDPLAMDMPAILEEHGIGGILAPQLLRSAGQSLLLDLAGGLLKLKAAACAEQARGPRGCSLSHEPIRACAPVSQGIGTLFALPIIVAGIATELVLDTGARETDLFLASSAGSHLAAKPSQRATPGHVASGDSVDLQIDSVAISVGSCSFESSVTLVSGSSGALCQRDGVLGIDFLRACELVIDDVGLTGTCRLGSAHR